MRCVSQVLLLLPGAVRRSPPLARDAIVNLCLDLTRRKNKDAKAHRGRD